MGSDSQKADHPKCWRCGHSYNGHDTGWDAAGCMMGDCACQGYLSLPYDPLAVDHPFAVCGHESEGCGAILADGKRCGLPRAAHPAEPAPESEEPPNPKQHGSNRVRCQCPGCYCTVPACWQTWLCFHCGEDEECCHEEPARPEPSPSLRSVMREILRATGDGHHHDGIVSEEDQCPTCSDVTRLLESVVAAAKRGEFGE